MVSGFTQVVAVIGHPITQVKSPENFNRFFADQQMDSVMIPVDIAPEAVADFLQALRGWHNMSGVLVTVPHKQRAAALVDELTPRAQHLNAINVIRKLADGRLQGDMLDGVGFQLAAEAHGFSAGGKKGLLSGCGGVGSAIAWGLCEAGIRQLALYDQNPATLQLLHNRLATHPLSTHVADVVTAPIITPLLAFARDRGCAIQTGPEMALAQMKLMGQFIGAIALEQGAAA